MGPSIVDTCNDLLISGLNVGGSIIVDIISLKDGGAHIILNFSCRLLMLLSALSECMVSLCKVVPEIPIT